ncbi:tryptophan 2,3-dioxygenase [Mycena alexandri]|uniref:Tryptophan 2,3-dioxygenase n=1 Tax=Mycena alexandri TaxID=1745969 RepID=A0AAD6WLM4_9AGAR|nr:tryptophan 2,3-dioxygenase [Mycena alexandri]
MSTIGTGFMPPQAPPSTAPNRLGGLGAGSRWCDRGRLALGDKTWNNPGGNEPIGIVEEGYYRELPVVKISGMIRSETHLAPRNISVLAWIMHFYIHSLPPKGPVVVPRPNYDVPSSKLHPASTAACPHICGTQQLPLWDNLQSHTLFSGHQRRASILPHLRADGAARGSKPSSSCEPPWTKPSLETTSPFAAITTPSSPASKPLSTISRALLATVRDGCDPTVFYTAIRPWFRGADSDPNKRTWAFDGLDSDPSWTYPSELSGPSAGQSSLIHALDMFLGVAEFSHASGLTGASSTKTDTTKKSPFLERMQLYMPRHHRNFLNHLAANPRPLRAIVTGAEDAKLLGAYNLAVGALKRLRDYHITIVTSYIIQPARLAAAMEAKAEGVADGAAVEGHWWNGACQVLESR